MRNAFINTLEKEANKNRNILLLTGDLGFTVFENFQKKFSKRFFNMGVAEANMMSIAAGLALSGKIPFVYSIAPFIALRAYEQIRNDVCMHNANVKIIGVGGGLVYTHAGPTHHIAEDLAVMRVLPKMTVIAPIDPIEVRLAIPQILKKKGPAYLRLAKKGEPHLHQGKIKFEIGKGIIIKKGKDICLITCGPIAYNTLKAAFLLDKEKISTAVVSMHTIKPLDTNLLENLTKKYKAIFTVEEHSVIGGLGGAVAEFLAENLRKNLIFKRIGLNDCFCHEIGDYDFLRKIYNLSAQKIAKTIIRSLKKHE
ncbi:MAG: hypothetical protein NC935_04095 [Candidatus Omnitrophica bacterium]|nr:hypothetical protein [Candidatus Omnitrophota bacterium]